MLLCQSYTPHLNWAESTGETDMNESPAPSGKFDKWFEAPPQSYGYKLGMELDDLLDVILYPESVKYCLCHH